MHTSTRILATAVLAGALSAGAVAAPASAAENAGSAGTTLDMTTDQTATTTVEVQQDSGMKVKPHTEQTYTGVNESVVDQVALNSDTVDVESTGDLRTKSTVKQKASNHAKVDQGNMIALPHSTLYYYGVNHSTIDQDAINTSTTTTTSGGDVQSKSKHKQSASNTAEVHQGVVKALPHSTVHYHGENYSYIEQSAINTSTTEIDAQGSVESQETLHQETSNTADVQQGVTAFPNSTVHGTGDNTSVIVPPTEYNSGA